MVNSDLEKSLKEINLYQKNELNKVREQYYTERKRDLNEDNENIFEANSYLFGNNLGNGITFGVTFIYGGKIFILDTLKGEDRAKVVEHEKHHRNNPSDSEFMTRKRTCTEEFYPNPAVSPVNYN